MNFDLVTESELWLSSRGIPCKSFSSIDSTSSYAKAEAASTEASLVIYSARHQTAGRGRGTHSWEDRTEETFLTSWSFAVDQNPQPITAALVGLALFDSVKAAWPHLPFSLKAPNDIYLDKEKVIGILLEAIDGTQKRLIVSFGFNVFGSPLEVETATSLKKHHPSVSAVEWRKFLANALKELQNAVSEGLQERMTSSKCERLRQALNLNPNLAEKLTHVEADGSLRTQTHISKWQDL